MIFAQPFIYCSVAILICACLYFKKKKNKRAKLGYGENLRVVIILIFYALQPSIVKNAFQLFLCRDFGFENNPDMRLRQDTSIECGSSIQVLWVLILGLPSLLFWVAFPIGWMIKNM